MKNQFKFKGTGNAFLVFSVLFFFLFSLNFVSAVPAPQTNVNVDLGYTISYPKYTEVQQNQPFNLSVHVYNRSNGLPVYTPLCYLEIYNHQGNYLINEQSLLRIGNEYSYYMTAGNFSKIDTYHYNIACNTTDYGGFVDGLFNITSTGQPLNSNFFWLILVLAAGMILLGFSIGDGWVVILGTFGLYFIGIYTLFYGIVGVKDAVTTNSFAIIILGLAGYLSIKSGLEIINNG